jgi:hypothetical protein
MPNQHHLQPQLLKLSLATFASDGHLDKVDRLFHDLCHELMLLLLASPLTVDKYSLVLFETDPHERRYAFLAIPYCLPHLLQAEYKFIRSRSRLINPT